MKITDTNIKVTLFTKSTRGRFAIDEDLDIMLIDGSKISISKGTVSNGASVPKLLRGIYSNIGTYTLPAVVHDYLYENNLYNRKFADRQFLIDMGKTNTNYFTKWLFYYTVRIFGGINWKKYGTAKY
jgi:hypothetical protein